ncbi:anhydro-N-acetylmuramic acid kinase [Sediminibacterium sp.]|uniref:anhydro-N-acetylmuramic acid kinase n=1 Tax=Sediminibacterium sp. TaxID=1917865 RepID=UPI0025D49F09|nr:anhydro-N-acetylmuramic acid kinase [Sediminibacterium sp.]MBW0177561.1 anhydro-N-acetylmuramic acid kinase [Sediminibacterium sp.]
MNQNIAALYKIANKPERTIIGLMSGTSVDGLDVALCRFSGQGMDTNLQLLAFETVSYNAAFKNQIKSVFSKRQVDLEKVCLLNAWVALEHANIILDCLKKWQKDPADVDLIASHGQTIYHAPKFLHPDDEFGNATLQIGDGDHMAVATGIITLSDFRQKHVAAGGEGAPLAVYGDYLIFSNKNENRIMLNIGGIANFTYLPSSLDASAVFSTDVGTGNTLMDAYVQEHFPGKYFDEDAAIAKQGTIHTALLNALKENDFFSYDFPKTIGPELFNLQYLADAVQKSAGSHLSHADIMATLNRFSADMIVDALQRSMGTRTDFVAYVSGGGMHNLLLMQHIKEQLPGIVFKNTNELEVNPDAKEAVLFAILANEAVCGGEVKLGAGRNGIPAVSMGKISFPK